MKITGRKLTRKDMLKIGALGGAAMLLPLGHGRRAVAKDYESAIPNFTPYQARLKIPEVLRPVRRTETTDFYEITMREALAEVVPGYRTPVWGYNGQFPGPTIVAREDRRISVLQKNDLPVPTSVHHHGAYVDGDSDGHPLDLIQPGGQKEYLFGNEQCARTQWYHDHAMHTTATNVYRGLAGLFVITDDLEEALPLPKGDHDVPLVIQDRVFDENGAFFYPADAVSNEGLLGDIPVVNGVAQPRFEVAARKYRFRLLNGSNARPYDLALSSGRPFTVIASEGGLFESPVRGVTRLPVAPAERYEIIVDFSEYGVGEKVVLENRRVDGDEATREIMRFDVVRSEADDSVVPDVLRPAEDAYDDTHLPPDPNNVVRRREFRFNKDGPMFTINGLTFDGDRIDADPREGDTEIWKVYNNSGGWIHPVHVHLVNFKILDRNGRPPEPWERGWKDTVIVGEGEDVRIMMRWPKVPVEGERGPFAHRYVFHCHNLEHEDHDMMAQIGVEEHEVKAPDVVASRPAGTYTTDQEVSLTSSDPAAAIFYTLDGSAPHPSGTRYAGPITVGESLTLKAMAVDATGYRGPVASFEYVLDRSTTLSLAARPARIVSGKRTILSGRLLDAEGEPLGARRVELHHRSAGKGEFERLRRAETREDGAYAFSGVKPKKSTDYRVVFEGDDSDHEASTSPTRRVKVKRKTRRR